MGGADGWDGVWGDIYIYIYIYYIYIYVYDDPKVEADASTAIHQLKHGILEEVGYNKV